MFLVMLMAKSEDEQELALDNKVAPHPRSLQHPSQSFRLIS